MRINPRAKASASLVGQCRAYSPLCVVVAGVLAAGGGPAHAQVGAVPDSLDPIIVTGASLPRTAGEAAFGSVIIDRERLQTEASGRLENILADVAGLQLFRRTDSRAANPTSQGVTLRALGGNASSRALVLLDGVPVADPFGGWIPFPALDPQRLGAVRVTRGGGAGAFGNGALAGTIELFSASAAQAAGLSAEVAAGSRESFSAAGRLGVPVGQGVLQLVARAERGDGYALVPEQQRGPIDVGASYRQYSGSMRTVVPLGEVTEAQFSALAFDDQRRRGLVGAGSLAQGTDASVRLVGRGDVPWEALAFAQWRQFETQFARVADVQRTQSEPTLDQFSTPARGWGGKLEVRPALDVAGLGMPLALRLGVDARATRGRTNERGRLVNSAFTRLRQGGGNALDLGGYAEADATVRPGVMATFGARLDRWWQRDGFFRETDIATLAPVIDEAYADRSGWETSLRGGLVATPTQAITLRAAAYQGFRLPTLNELYRPFRVGSDGTAANAGLRPERLHGVEAGARYAPAPAVDLEVTLFWNVMRGAIANVTRAEGPGVFPGIGFVAGTFRQRDNLDQLRSAGAELSARLQVGAWRLQGAYSYTDARIEDAASPLDGLRPALTSRHQASATALVETGQLGLALPPGGSASATLRYAGNQFADDLQALRLGDAVTLDLGARQPVGARFTVELRGENVTGTQVRAGLTSDGIVDLASPRTLWIGLRYGG